MLFPPPPSPSSSRGGKRSLTVPSLSLITMPDGKVRSMFALRCCLIMLDFFFPSSLFVLCCFHFGLSFLSLSLASCVLCLCVCERVYTLESLQAWLTKARGGVGGGEGRMNEWKRRNDIVVVVSIIDPGGRRSGQTGQAVCTDLHSRPVGWWGALSDRARLTLCRTHCNVCLPAPAKAPRTAT